MSEETEMINANKEKSNREAEVNRETNLNYFNENMRNSNANKNLDMNINNLDMPMQMQMSNLQNFNAQNNLPSSLNNISNWNNSNTNNNFNNMNNMNMDQNMFQTFLLFQKFMSMNMNNHTLNNPTMNNPNPNMNMNMPTVPVMPTMPIINIPTIPTISNIPINNNIQNVNENTTSTSSSQTIPTQNKSNINVIPTSDLPEKYTSVLPETSTKKVINKDTIFIEEEIHCASSSKSTNKYKENVNSNLKANDVDENLNANNEITDVAEAVVENNEDKLENLFPPKNRKSEPFIKTNDIKLSLNKNKMSTGHGSSNKNKNDLVSNKEENIVDQIENSVKNDKKDKSEKRDTNLNILSSTKPSSNFDDIPIKSTQVNFMELLEKNLADVDAKNNENLNNNYNSNENGNENENDNAIGNAIEKAKKIRQKRFKKVINISKPTETKKYKYYADNFENKEKDNLALASTDNINNNKNVNSNEVSKAKDKVKENKNVKAITNNKSELNKDKNNKKDQMSNKNDKDKEEKSKINRSNTKEKLKNVNKNNKNQNQIKNDINNSLMKDEHLVTDQSSNSKMINHNVNSNINANNNSSNKIITKPKKPEVLKSTTAPDSVYFNFQLIPDNNNNISNSGSGSVENSFKKLRNFTKIQNQNGKANWAETKFEEFEREVEVERKKEVFVVKEVEPDVALNFELDVYEPAESVDNRNKIKNNVPFTSSNTSIPIVNNSRKSATTTPIKEVNKRPLIEFKKGNECIQDSASRFSIGFTENLNSNNNNKNSTSNPNTNKNPTTNPITNTNINLKNNNNNPNKNSSSVTPLENDTKIQEEITPGNEGELEDDEEDADYSDEDFEIECEASTVMYNNFDADFLANINSTSNNNNFIPINNNNTNNLASNSNIQIPNSLLENKELFLSKIKEINNEIQKLKGENEKVTKLKIEYEKLTRKLNQDIRDHADKKEKELRDVEIYKEEEIKKMQKDKKVFERNFKYNQNIPSKKDKDEIEVLKAQIIKMQEDFKVKDNSNRIIIDKLKKQLEEANGKISDLTGIITGFSSNENNENEKEKEKNKKKMSRDSNQNINICQKINSIQKKTSKNNIEKNYYTKNLKSESKEEEENYDLIFLEKYHPRLYQPKLIKSEKSSDGKIIKNYDNDKREIIFPSGVRKEIFSDGYQVYPDGKTVYFFNEAKTVQTTFPDNLQIFKFENGQIEKHFPDGSKQICFTDGAFRYILPDGYEETYYPDDTDN